MNLNSRSLEDDREFETCVLSESEAFARGVDRDVRDEDTKGSTRVGEGNVHGATRQSLRTCVRNPPTLLLIASRES